MVFGVSTGGGGETSKPGTLGARLAGERRFAEEASSEASSELEPLPPLGLGGEDLRSEGFLFLLFFFLSSFFFDSDGVAFLVGTLFGSKTS